MARQIVGKLGEERRPGKDFGMTPSQALEGIPGEIRWWNCHGVGDNILKYLYLPYNLELYGCPSYVLHCNIYIYSIHIIDTYILDPNALCSGVN